MIAIRHFEEGDAPSLADLMREMARFYGATVDPSLAAADDIIRRARTIDIVVAHDGVALLGFATFASLYPVAGLVAFTYIQQVYVGLHARRRGVARHLLAGIARIAKARGCTRIEWSTGQENTAARALYESLGAKGSTKIYYVLEEAALNELAG